MQVLNVPYASREASALFYRSLRETGFAVITGHPISQQLIFDTFAEWQEFFFSTNKFDYTFDPQLQSGYFPFRSENAKDSPIKDLKEFYHLFPWSTLPNQLSNNTWDLFRRMTDLAAELLGWIQREMPQPVRTQLSMPLDHMIAESRETLLRVIHYPPLTGSEEAGAIRAAAHEDINLITLLPAATAPGLEVLAANGQWVAVECDPGTIVVNAGDMLQMATDNFFRSTTHRVVNPRQDMTHSSRFSMPLFLHPRRDVKLSSSHTAGSYLAQRLEEIGLKSKT